MVTKREVLQELTLPKLKKIAQRLGIQVRKGITGFLGERTFGVELRGPYVETLANSPIVTLEEIDRVLGTNYSGHSRAERTPTEEPTTRRSARPQENEGPEQSAPEEDNQYGIEYVLGRFLYKEDLQAICEELDLPVSGSKGDLTERVLADDDFQVEMALSYIDKDGLKELANELELRTGGTREDLERRIIEVIALREPNIETPTPPTRTQGQAVRTPVGSSLAEPATAVPRPPARRELFSPQTAFGEPPLEFPDEPQPALIPEPKAPLIAQLQMVAEFLDSYRPSQRFRNEQAYEIEIAQAMRHHFGPENVKTQANIPGGRIDIEVLGVGVEIKVPASRTQLQTLLGQISGYRSYYGPNVVVLIFNDFAKVQDVNEFSNLLRGRGIQVFVK